MYIVYFLLTSYKDAAYSEEQDSDRSKLNHVLVSLR